MASDQIPVTLSERRIMAQTTLQLTVKRDLGWRRVGLFLIKLGAFIVGMGTELEVEEKGDADVRSE